MIYNSQLTIFILCLVFTKYVMISFIISTFLLYSDYMAYNILIIITAQNVHILMAELSTALYIALFQQYPAM